MTIKAPGFQKKKKPVPMSFHEVEQRLNAARAAVEHIWTPSAEETGRTLQTRALALAQEALRPQAVDEGIQVVEFTLGYESYAIELHYVIQVACLENIIPLPCTPAFVCGVVNLRGQMFPVMDLKKFFELPENESTDPGKIIVLRSGKIIFGILADEIVSVRRIRATDIQPSLPTLTGVRKNYLKGVTSERWAVLDAAKLIMDESIVVEEQVQ